ncbi:hypothetical protein A3K62_00590 [Candidatus Pacearchaeota archaeon RBG_16_35_8]|nr:MAG: hypothetical protein A3K62_00590 [Candidatus Pacearchaeota archaeon RBG_16_35_8]
MTNERDRIIVAEDDDAMLDLSLEILKQRFGQFKFESFSDGTSLEKRLNEGVGNVRLVITDNEMPGSSGSQLIRKYAAQPEFSGIKFILCYGGDNKIGERALEEGAYAFIKKPYSVDVYVNVLEKALDL